MLTSDCTLIATRVLFLAGAEGLAGADCSEGSLASSGTAAVAATATLEEGAAALVAATSGGVAFAVGDLGGMGIFWDLEAGLSGFFGDCGGSAP